MCCFPADQAHDANALMLAGKRDVLVTTLPLEESYLGTILPHHERLVSVYIILTGRRSFQHTGQMFCGSRIRWCTLFLRQGFETLFLR